jgi:hypothetical protein
VEQVVVIEAELVGELKRAGRAVHLGDGNAPVEGHDGCRCHLDQLVVERQDLAPVCLRGSRGIAVHGVDGSLKLVGAGPVAAQACADEILALAHHGVVPPAAVLVREQDQRAAGPRAGLAARLGQEQQGQQAADLGLVGHQLGQQPREADGLRAQFGADERIPGRSRISLVEHEVDDRKHEGEAVGQLRVPGHPVGNPGGPDLPLGPDQALGNRGLGDEESTGDLGRLEPGDEPQGESDLGLGRQGRMTAGEDQPQAVIVHGSHLR